MSSTCPMCKVDFSKVTLIPQRAAQPPIVPAKSTRNTKKFAASKAIASKAIAKKKIAQQVYTVKPKVQEVLIPFYNLHFNLYLLYWSVISLL